MPPHLSIKCLVIYLRLNGSQGNRAFVFDQQAAEIFFFAAQQPLFKGNFTIAVGDVVAIEYSLRWRRQIDILNHFALALDDSAFKNVFELSYVSGPLVSEHLVEHIR